MMLSSSTLALIGIAALPLLQPCYAQRDNAVVYLTNCATSDTGAVYSEASYYYDVTKSFDGQGPDRYQDTSLGQVTTWEGADITWFYASTHSPQPDSFRELINADAQDPNIPTFSAVGCGHFAEGFEAGVIAYDMICYKDDPRVLYTTSDHECSTVYYCRTTTTGNCPLPGNASKEQVGKPEL